MFHVNNTESKISRLKYEIVAGKKVFLRSPGLYEFKYYTNRICVWEFEILVPHSIIVFLLQIS